MTLDRTKAVAFDLETQGTEFGLPEYGLQPYRLPKGEARISSYGTAFYDGPKIKVNGATFPDRYELHRFLEYISGTGRTLITWNGSFDIAWLIAEGLLNEVLACTWLDGMLLKRHLEVEPEYDTNRSKKKSYRLKQALIEHWPQLPAGYEEGIDFQDNSPIMVAKRFKYNQLDCVGTLLETERCYNALEASDPRRLNAALIEAKCLPLIALSKVMGLSVDKPYTTKLAAALDEQAARLLKQLEPMGVTADVVRSPKKLADTLFNKWGLTSLKTTDGGDPSTDKEVLHELSFLDPRAKLVRQYREALNGKAKYPGAILESVEYNGDGRTRPEIIIFGTYTGRCTMSSKQGKNKDERPTGFALAQMKRGSTYRRMLSAPEDHDIVELDAAGQEFRWMAIMSGDETMQQLCMPGEDAHSFMGSQIAGKEYRQLVRLYKEGSARETQDRYLGKVANLSLQYRTSAKTLRVRARVDYDIPMTPEEAVHIHSIFPQAYKGVPVYWANQIALSKSLGYAETLAGRRVQLTGNWTSRDERWQLESTAINYPIQGVGADQKCLALAVLRNVMMEYQARFAWELYDGIYFYVPKRKSKEAAIRFQSLLNNLPYAKAWGFTPPIPLPWDAKVGPSWGDLKEIKE